MKRYGLLGRSLGHSFSPLIHGLLGDYSYELFPREEREIAALLAREDLGGLNVTIPYKETVLPYLSQVSEQARRIGCVNTILFREDGLHGHNTDYDGFALTLDSLKQDWTGATALILGQGATARTVAAVLQDKGVASIRRLGRGDYPLKEEAAFQADLLVNCTPVGMYPNNGESLVDLSQFHHLQAVLDVIYNPHRSKLLLDAKALGIPHRDGLLMLVGQAMAAAELFSGKSIPREKAGEILWTIRRDTDNIILIGMPGCGKTTVGKGLSQLLSKRFVDSDEVIAAQVGMTIPEYFQSQGEAAFRKVEKSVLAALGKEHGQIIATGGGAVKDPENYPALAQNGRLYFLERSLAELDVTGRPLSRGGRETLKTLYEERESLYRAFADQTVQNLSIAETAARIAEDFNEHCHH